MTPSSYYATEHTHKNHISKLRNLVCITQLVTEKAQINRDAEDQPKIFNDVDDSTDVFQMLTYGKSSTFTQHLSNMGGMLGARVPDR